MTTDAVLYLYESVALSLDVLSPTAHKTITFIYKSI